MEFRTREPTAISPTLDYTLLSNYRGETTRIQIRRGSQRIEYDRTNRRAFGVFESPEGALHTFFSRTRDFAEIFKNASLLDLGCGGGGLVSDLRTQGLNIIGLDLHLSDACKRQKAYTQGDAFELPFSNESFDAILSIYSVFHYEPLQNQEVLFNETLRVLKPNGRILLAPLAEGPRLDFLRVLANENHSRIIRATENGALQIIKLPLPNRSPLP